MAKAERGSLLTAFAVGFVLLAISNLLKPLHLGAEEGLVFFGKRLAGLPNTILAPLMAVFQFVYAAGIWRLKRYAMPMSHAYASYVILNLILFSMRNPSPSSVSETAFTVVYAIVAIGVSVGTAILLTQRKAELS
jgi:hypothetical protein